MKASSLNTRVQILANTGGVDTLGQPTQAWTLAQTVWADVRYQTGLQSLNADRLNSGGRASIRIRQTSCSKGITSAMRAVVGGTLVDGTVTGGTVYKIMDTPRQGRDAIDLVVEAL
jgi:SPP1 family predicted phage head-tail adaptor